MIAGIFHQGSGLGNQLHRYVATRVLAKDKGYQFGMMNPHLFKGDSFLFIEKGKDPIPKVPTTSWFNFSHSFVEKKIVEDDVDIRSYDPEINFVQDNTIIDGEFQDPRYFEHRLPEIDQWLAVDPLEMDSNICVIGFRGGEYRAFPELFLPKEYWDNAIFRMRKLNPNVRFEVHTDDPMTASMFFPTYPIVNDIGINWRSMRYAKQAIIANSSFYILPRLLNGGLTIAPRYWARHNTKVWALPQNYYKQFTYIHAEDTN